MPSIKNYEKKKSSAGHSKKTEQAEFDFDVKAKKNSSAKRRPGRDAEAAHHESREAPPEAPHLDPHEETLIGYSVDEEATSGNHSPHREFSEGSGPHREGAPGESPFKTIHVRIMGAELLTLETPQKVIDFTDSLVEEWKQDGNFEALPLGNPLAQTLAAKGFRKAKDIEKKLEEKGVFALAQMGLSILKSKLKK